MARFKRRKEMLLLCFGYHTSSTAVTASMFIMCFGTVFESSWSPKQKQHTIRTKSIKDSKGRNKKYTKKAGEGIKCTNSLISVGLIAMTRSFKQLCWSVVPLTLCWTKAKLPSAFCRMLYHRRLNCCDHHQQRTDVQQLMRQLQSKAWLLSFLLKYILHTATWMQLLISALIKLCSAQTSRHVMCRMQQIILDVTFLFLVQNCKSMSRWWRPGYMLSSCLWWSIILWYLSLSLFLLLFGCSLSLSLSLPLSILLSPSPPLLSIILYLCWHQVVEHQHFQMFGRAIKKEGEQPIMRWITAKNHSVHWSTLHCVSILVLVCIDEVGWQY